MTTIDKSISPRFPVKVLGAAVLLTGVIVLWLGWRSFDLYQTAKHTRARNSRIQELQGAIIHLDEVLTMSARMAASTGDPHWEQRYQEFEPQLGAAIKEAIRLAPKAYSGEAAGQTDAANIALVDMEKQAFALVRQGRLEQAQALLFSENYESQKQIYARGMASFSAGLKQAALATIRSERGTVFISLVMVAVAIIILLVAWLLVLRAMHRWQAALINSHQQTARSSSVLSGINKIFQETLACETDSQVARVCLTVAQQITGSKFGFVGEINKEGAFDTIALTDPGWDACKVPRSEAGKMLKDMIIRGLWGKVISDRQSLIANNPPLHPASVGTPEGHPPLTSFLGVPLLREDKIVGMIALANKEAGYGLEDQHDLEALSAAFVEALERKRAELELNRHRENLEGLVKARTAELQRTNQQLTRSNRELEQFAYVASHDLQEPLRMISSFTQLLADNYMGKLDKDADEFITFACDGAKRMQRLISDLLTLSRVDTRGKPLTPTNCETVLDMALDNLKMTIAESGAHITRGPLPTVMADELQLMQLLQNLIGNAIKFRGSDQPHVKVGAEKQNGEWIFSVSDNGIGIKHEYYDQIFKIFQRLHAVNEYSGTGIGLAVCKKIVERHEGRIWIESEEGEGSTFYFSIPVTED